MATEVKEDEKMDLVNIENGEALKIWGTSNHSNIHSNTSKIDNNNRKKQRISLINTSSSKDTVSLQASQLNEEPTETERFDDFITRNKAINKRLVQIATFKNTLDSTIAGSYSIHDIYYSNSKSQEDIAKYCHHAHSLHLMPAASCHHPIIGFDVEAAVDDIKSGDRIKRKPLFATIRGHGAGKTRCLDAMRCAILGQQAMSGVAVTFNHLSGIAHQDGVLIDITKDEITNGFILLEIMITARILSSIYLHLDLPAALRLILATLKNVRLSATWDECYPGSIVEDETVIADAFVRRKFPDCNSIAPIVRGILSNLDLFKDTKACEMLKLPSLDIQMVISSVQDRAIGMTLSRREVRLIPVPEKLDPEQIVADWFVIPADHLPSSRSTYKLLATLASSLPRTVDVIARYIAALGKPVLDSELVTKIISHTCARLISLYNVHNEPPAFPMKVSNAIMYNELISVDDTIMRYVKNGFIVSKLTAFRNEHEPSLLEPKINMLYLYALIVNSKSTCDGLVIAIKNVVDGTLLAMKEANNNKTRIIDMLECIIETMIRQKLELNRGNTVTLTVSKLLGIRSNQRKSMASMLSIKIDPSIRNQRLPLENDSHVKPAEFFTELRGANKVKTLYVVTPHRDECFDLALLFPLETGVSKRKLILLDYKSSYRGTVGESEIKTASEMLKEFSQAIYAAQLFADTPDFEICFVYMSSYMTNWNPSLSMIGANFPPEATIDGIEVVIKKTSQYKLIRPEYMPNMYVTNPDEMSQFLSFAKDIYEVGRSMI